MPNHPTAKQMQDASDRALVSGYLPYVRMEMEGMKTALVNSTQAKLMAGQLTPQDALLAWQEFFLYTRTVQRLEMKAANPVS